MQGEWKVIGMSKYPELYTWSLKNAKKYGEVDRWRASHKENEKCTRAIEEAIRRDFDGMHLKDTCAKSVIDQFGFDRVGFVLRNTLQQLCYDGRFSPNNVEWANKMHIPDSNKCSEYVVRSHPTILNGFVDEAREEWRKLGLFDQSHCSQDEQDRNYQNKVVVLSPNALVEECKTPDNQLFFATGGFGCHPDKMGRKVYGYFLNDGEHTHFNRSEIIGVLKDEFLPDWAKEELSEQTEETADEEECESEGMGGIS